MKAMSAWPDFDVLVELKGSKLLLSEEPHTKNKFRHGVVSGGNIELTAEEARKLANELIMAADYSEQIEKSYNEFMEKEILINKTIRSDAKIETE